MKKIHKILVGLFVALAVAAPLGILALSVQPTTAHPVSIVRVAGNYTPTPTPPGGAPCPGHGC